MTIFALLSSGNVPLHQGMLWLSFLQASLSARITSTFHGRLHQQLRSTITSLNVYRMWTHLIRPYLARQGQSYSGICLLLLWNTIALLKPLILQVQVKQRLPLLSSQSKPEINFFLIIFCFFDPMEYNFYQLHFIIIPGAVPRFSQHWVFNLRSLVTTLQMNSQNRIAFKYA